MTDALLSDEQQLLQETTRRLLETHGDLTRVRALIDDPLGFDRDLWRRGADMGWFGLAVAEDAGGSGVEPDGIVNLAIVAEELGRLVQPGPFLPTAVVAFALAAFATGEQWKRWGPGLLTGDTVASWCADTELTARRDGDGWVLDGRATLVQDLHAADVVLLTATTDEYEPVQVLVEPASAGADLVALESLDLARRFGSLVFTGVRVPSESVLPVDGATAAVERQRQLALVLQCAECVGVATRAMEFTVEYARDRVAFGRPIGSYQAIKHRLAEAMMRSEAAAAATSVAVHAVQDHSPDAARAVSVAKSYVGDACATIVEDCLQVHGGIGFTWDHDVHLYLRRAKVNQVVYGTPSWHRDRLCTILGVDGEAARHGD